MPAGGERGTDYSVLEVLRRDVREFEEIFEYTIRITGGEIPFEPLNDLRNGVAHLAAALRSQSAGAAKREIENGQGHIILATSRSVVVAVRIMEAYLLAYIREAKQTRGIRPRIMKIRETRERIGAINPIERPERGVSVAHVDGLNDRADALGILFAECMELYLEVLAKYPLPNFRSPSSDFLRSRRVRTRLAQPLT
jgi:hypothetical protein